MLHCGSKYLFEIILKGNGTCISACIGDFHLIHLHFQLVYINSALFIVQTQVIARSNGHDEGLPVNGITYIRTRHGLSQQTGILLEKMIQIHSTHDITDTYLHSMDLKMLNNALREDNKLG